MRILISFAIVILMSTVVTETVRRPDFARASGHHRPQADRLEAQRARSSRAA